MFYKEAGSEGAIEVAGERNKTWFDPAVVRAAQSLDKRKCLWDVFESEDPMGLALSLEHEPRILSDAGMEFPLTEYFSLQGAYSHANSPMPASTLTPLTAAIMSDTLSTGLTYSKGRYRMQFAYQVNVPQRRVTKLADQFARLALHATRAASII